MRDRQPFGNIPQREVIQATCSSAQVPSVQVPAKSVDSSNITPDPMGMFPPTYYPAPSYSVNHIQKQQQQQPSGNKKRFLKLKF
jgi:hypothetical protein